MIRIRGSLFDIGKTIEKLKKIVNEPSEVSQSAFIFAEIVSGELVQ